MPVVAHPLTSRKFKVNLVHASVVLILNQFCVLILLSVIHVSKIKQTCAFMSWKGTHV